MADEKEKLNSSLQCHVCFEDYKVNTRIWQCKSGHSVCTPCRKQISECPFCKAPYQGTRNFAVEEIIRELNKKSDDDDDGDDNNPLSKPSAPEMDYADTVPTVASSKFRNQENRGCGSSSQPRARQNVSDDTADTVDPEFRDMVVVNASGVRRRTAQQNFDNVWINCHSHSMPSNMIVGGRDHGNTPLYIGRAEHRNALIPGKVHPEYEKCYVAWGGSEHEKKHFQVLTDVSGTWLPNSGGTIPENAVPGGHTEIGETLYIGRAEVAGTLAIGKVHPSHGRCYVSYGGEEHGYRNYEIFVLYP